MKIDSHQHFWKLKRGDYHWLTPELGILYKDYLPTDLEQHLVRSKVGRTILIQAAASIEETDFLLSLAEQYSFIAGVVGWIDMLSTDATQRIDCLSKINLFKGIRPMLQDIEDVDWILNSKFEAIFEKLIHKNLTFDALVTEKHLANIKIIATRYPSLKIVIDHFAKPDTSSSDTHFWLSQMDSFTDCKNVYVKLSGLIAETDRNPVRKIDLQEYVHTVIDIFGTERIMWGSNWPVLNLKSSYQSWISLTDKLLAQYSPNIRAKIWSQNAALFYNIGLNK